MLQWTLGMHLFKSRFPPDKCPGVGLLNHMVVPFLVFQEPPYCFYRGCSNLHFWWWLFEGTEEGTHLGGVVFSHLSFLSFSLHKTRTSCRKGLSLYHLAHSELGSGLNKWITYSYLIDIYRTLHPETVNFTIFSSAHGTFSRIDHILGYKSSLGKFKKLNGFT